MFYPRSFAFAALLVLFAVVTTTAFQLQQQPLSQHVRPSGTCSFELTMTNDIQRRPTTTTTISKLVDFGLLQQRRLRLQ